MLKASFSEHSKQCKIHGNGTVGVKKWWGLATAVNGQLKDHLQRVAPRMEMVWCLAHRLELAFML